MVSRKVKTQKAKLWLVVGLAGVFGAISRWSIYLLLESLMMSSSVVTFMINISGCLVLGLVLGSWSQKIDHLNHIASGFLGSYTTFSTVMVDSFVLWSSSNLLAPVFLFFSQTLLGYIAFKLGKSFVSSINMKINGNLQENTSPRSKEHIV